MSDRENQFGAGGNRYSGAFPAGVEDDPDFWPGGVLPNFDFGPEDAADLVFDTSSLPLEAYELLNLGLPAGIRVYRHPYFPSVRVFF